MSTPLDVMITIDPFLLMFIIALWSISLLCFALVIMDLYYKSFTHYKRKLKRLQKYNCKGERK